MPSTVGADLARKFAAMARETRQATPVAVRAAALAATTEMRQAIERDAPGGRMRGVGKKGAKVGARFDMRGDGAVVKAVGPVHLLERPTKAHEIKPRGGRSGKKAIAFAGVARASAQHRGTRGKRTWSRGVDAAKPKAARELRAPIGKAMARGARA